MITNSYNLMDFLPKNVNPVQEFGEKASSWVKKLTNSNLRKADSLQAAVVADYHPALTSQSSGVAW